MINHQEGALLAEFRLMTPDERNFFVQTAKIMMRERRKQKPRPSLVLVTSNVAPKVHSAGGR